VLFEILKVPGLVLAKRFQTVLEADGKGEILSAMKGSAGYGAIERVVVHLSQNKEVLCCKINKAGQH